MKLCTKHIGLFGFVFSLLIAVAALAHNKIIEIEKPIKAQSLSGLVQIGHSRDGAPGVLVEEFTKDWKTVKASTHTDENGHFSLSSENKGGIHYLRLSHYGINTLRVKVKIDRAGPKELSLTLSPST